MASDDQEIIDELETTEGKLAVVENRLPSLMETADTLERKIAELQAQNIVERFIRFFLGWLDLDGKHNKVKALQKQHQKIQEEIDKYKERQFILELKYRETGTKMAAFAKLAQTADEKLQDISDPEIRDMLRKRMLEYLEAMDLGGDEYGGI